MPAPSLDHARADIAACRAIIRHGSKSFHAASLLLPPRIRDAAISLYAFCRIADDLIDDGDDPENAVAFLRQRLDRAYAGRPADHAADRAFAAVAAAYDIPHSVPAALIEGFAWDTANRRYDTIDDVLAYATRVAGTVGIMMAVLMGRRQQHVLARACELGLAMQLTNIARDVGQDARDGRLYLPRDWLREEGVDPNAFLAAPSFSPALGRVVARLLAEADRHYLMADTGIAALPLSCRPAIRAARLIYAEIGREVARLGYDSVSRRAITSSRRKLSLAACAAVSPFSFLPCSAAPAVPQTSFLVTAAACTQGSPQSLDDRIGWVIDVVDRLERRDRPRAAMAVR